MGREAWFYLGKTARLVWSVAKAMTHPRVDGVLRFWGRPQSLFYTSKSILALSPWMTPQKTKKLSNLQLVFLVQFVNLSATKHKSSDSLCSFACVWLPITYVQLDKPCFKTSDQKRSRVLYTTSRNSGHRHRKTKPKSGEMLLSYQTRPRVAFKTLRSKCSSESRQRNKKDLTSFSHLIKKCKK